MLPVNAQQTLPESEHRYKNNFYGEWDYTHINKDVEGLFVTFSDNTYVEDGDDYYEIYFEDEDGEAERLSEAEVEATLGHSDPETVQLIRAALKHLPPEERSLITMFYYEEMSVKDIAYVTDSPPNTIGSKLFRTRKKLCKIIQMLQS